jgi:predicted alpha/beta hydrolase family esterase
MMRTTDSHILFVPGYTGSGPEHWQTRWESRLSTAARVEQDDWDHPEPEAWNARIIEAVRAATRPVVLVAHSLGVVAVARAAPSFPAGSVQGAYLVAPADVEEPGLKPEHLHAFAPIPREPLPFPSILVASRTDPYCSYERAEDFGAAWGSKVVDAGEAGHINMDSGFGPWPEGLMSFAGFLRGL